MKARSPLVAALLATLLSSGCDRQSSRAVPPPQDRAASTGEVVVEVTTVRVRRGAIAQRISAPGSLVARRESHIGTEVTGRLLHVYVSEGDRVDGGAPLFQVDPAPYEMAVRQAALAVAQARERQAQEAVALARHNVDRTTVRAPYAGSIAKRLADEGTTALVQPQTIVVVLQETGELEAHAAIPESQLALVQVGDRATLYVEGLAEPIEATVSAVNDTIDPATRTYLVKMPVANPERSLKAGVFAHVEISPRAKSDVLLVPPEAIRSEEGLTRLLVVRDGKAEAVPIEVGLNTEDAAEVLKGIGEGEEIIVGEAARMIAPGMRVRPLPRSEGLAG